MEYIVKYFEYSSRFPTEFLLAGKMYYSQIMSYPDRAYIDQNPCIVIMDTAIFAKDWNEWKIEIKGQWQILVVGTSAWINFELQEDKVLYDLRWTGWY